MRQYFENLEWLNEFLLLADYIKYFIFRFPVVMFIIEGVLRRFIMIVMDDLWFFVQIFVLDTKMTFLMESDHCDDQRTLMIHLCGV